MSKFVISCPVCHSSAKASTGLFASKHIKCACGNVINVKTDRMTAIDCPSCGSKVLYDQADGTKAKCPVCHKPVADERANKLVRFRCDTCGCLLTASKDKISDIRCPLCDKEVKKEQVEQEIKKEELRASAAPAVIRYEGDNTTFVWKHPMTDFVTGSQLIVHESQEAVFFRNGEALDSFKGGIYPLETGVLPKMEKLYRLPVQGQPFHAEVYFVNLTTQMVIKWGTPSKVGLLDPATGLHVELGASGSFNLRVIDARKLLIKLVGTTGGLKQRDLFFSSDASAEGEARSAAAVNGGYFRTMISARVKANLARIIRENKLSVLELDLHLDSIGAALKEAINPDLAEYGLEMPEFYVATILTPEDGQDANFRRMKQQHADMYLKIREEEIKKAEAEAAYERRSVEAQTAARIKEIDAQGEAEAERIRAQARADAYRMQAEAEAQEMHMKGYTYQQETSRQVGLEAMKNGGAGSLSGITGEMMQMGVGLGVMGGVIGMTKEAVSPAAQRMNDTMQQAMNVSAWDCACGCRGNTGKFCPSCGSQKPEPSVGWDCECGCRGITSKFCPNCGSKKPEPPVGWDCECGCRGITSKFCPNCGSQKPEPPVGWDCECGCRGITSKFCPSCGGKKPEPSAGRDCEGGCGEPSGASRPDGGTEKPE